MNRRAVFTPITVLAMLAALWTGKAPAGAELLTEQQILDGAAERIERCRKGDVALKPTGPDGAALPIGTAVDIQRMGQPPREFTVDLGGGVKMEFVLILSGSFMMGEDEGAPKRNVHEATITKPFYLGKYEVTQDQWQAVMGNNPSHFKGAKKPVELVSWNDCQDFIGKLNVNLRAGGSTVTLPTEAQWEYACRAGTTTRWSFGDDPARLGECAWWVENTEGTTHPVGQKKPNAWGLYDMSGNVWEWCADRLDASTDWKPPAAKSHRPEWGWGRAMRGGSSCPGGSPLKFRCAQHLERGSDYRFLFLGFRVARTVTLGANS